MNQQPEPTSTTDTVGGISHTAKLFSGACLRDIPEEKQRHVSAAKFIFLLDEYNYYWADRWANGTVYYDWQHGDKRSDTVIAVRLYGKEKNTYVVNTDFFKGDENE